MKLAPKSDPPQPPPPSQARLGNQPGIEVNIMEVIRLTGMIIPHLAYLTEDQATFVTDMQYKLNQYGANSRVTWRQVYYLRDIKDRLLTGGRL